MSEQKNGIDLGAEINALLEDVVPKEQAQPGSQIGRLLGWLLEKVNGGEINADATVRSIIGADSESPDAR